ncbi:MAG: tRNA pseudouridine(55) synthase TruB [Oscillospiraceae bacterium]|jgi:tRNA pseudouridine55 synthase|nr:tRNA pseudouridine(55) synthase TruB [Oscillospiraceae bacterium]
MTGIVCLNKPGGITSFSAVSKVKGILGVKKAGHTGTLDPMATGVLPVAAGGATRFIELLPSGRKEYIANFSLGLTTDTLDITGEITGTYPVNSGPDDLKSVLALFRGEIEQIPPMYSAILKDGVRLYEFARKGIEIERTPRKVSIYSLELSGFDPDKNEYEIKVECSAGTYIRTLISDIGDKLSCGAVMTKLCRTGSNGFLLSQSYTIEQLEQLKKDDEIYKAVIPIEEILSNFNSITVTSAQATRFVNGGGLLRDRLREPLGEGLYRVYSTENVFLGIGEITDSNNELKVKKLYL